MLCEIAGKQKVLVTVASEAFGLLMWENCRRQVGELLQIEGMKIPLPSSIG